MCFTRQTLHSRRYSQKKTLNHRTTAIVTPQSRRNDIMCKNKHVTRNWFHKVFLPLRTSIVFCMLQLIQRVTFVPVVVAMVSMLVGMFVISGNICWVWRSFFFASSASNKTTKFIGKIIFYWANERYNDMLSHLLCLLSVVNLQRIKWISWFWFLYRRAYCVPYTFRV